VLRYVVTREPGPAWDRSRPMREQEGWDDHAAFMDALADEGFIVLGGPLGDADRAQHVVDAGSAAEIEARLAADPWEAAGILRTVAIERWTVLLDASA
jgi:uncharacterized protein YciI